MASQPNYNVCRKIQLPAREIVFGSARGDLAKIMALKVKTFCEVGGRKKLEFPEIFLLPFFDLL